MTQLTDRPAVECTCAVCQGFCQHVPGWFLPSEVEPAAQALGLDTAEFFRRHCTVDYWLSGRPVFVIRPRRQDEAGGQLSGVNPRGTCASYRDSRCMIHAVKPYECSRAFHVSDANDIDMHVQVAAAWRAADARALVRRLHGSDPEVPEVSFLDALRLMLPVR